MERYRIVVSDRAWSDIESTYDWVAEKAPVGAARWYNRLIESLRTLEASPERCPLAAEDPLFEEEVRQLLHRRRRSMYRILFTIRESEVHILYVRHSARDWLSEEDL